MKKIDKKGIFWFLFLTFVSTFLAEFWLMFKGYSFTGVPAISGQLTVAAAMFFPGISAFIVRKFITKEGFKDAGLKLGPKKYYLYVYLLIPVLFALIYGLTWLTGQAPDFSLQSFLSQYKISTLPTSPAIIILAIFISSITFAPLLNSIPAFGEEFGWRGYLLPKLLPLGAKKAFIISGIIWGLWHAPLILMGYRYGAYTFIGIIFFCVLLIFLGTYIGYLRIVSGSSYLAGFAHGVFNAQAYGVWVLLFPNVNPLLGGFAGLTGIFVFLLLTIWVFRKPEIKKLIAVS